MATRLPPTCGRNYLTSTVWMFVNHRELVIGSGGGRTVVIEGWDFIRGLAVEMMIGYGDGG